MKPPLAQTHTGMRVCARRILTENGRGYSGMRKEMAAHLEEVARRYYAGDVAVVDEFLQLYCFGEQARKRLLIAMTTPDAPLAQGEP